MPCASSSTNRAGHLWNESGHDGGEVSLGIPVRDRFGVVLEEPGDGGE
jgi:hypothetical protein